MSDASPVNLSKGIPETVLAPAPSTWEEELAAALAADGVPARREAVTAVAARYPRFLAAWASLAELAPGPVESYAYARVGYHRGLDALRAAGWRGTGYVRFEHQPNRGFLRALDALASAAADVAEHDEEERCRLFLVQLDPAWPAWSSRMTGRRPD